MSCSWLRSLLSSLVASSALLSIATAEEGSTKSPFAGLNDSPFQAQTESAEATGKLVDLTKETVEPISLSDGAKLIEGSALHEFHIDRYGFPGALKSVDAYELGWWRVETLHASSWKRSTKALSRFK